MHSDPNNMKAIAIRGIAFRNKRDFKRAVDDLTAAARLQPDVAALYLERGIAYRMMGDREHAIGDFKTALRLAPDEPADARAQLKAMGVSDQENPAGSGK